MPLKKPLEYQIGTNDSILTRIKSTVFKTLFSVDHRFLPNRIFIFFISLLIFINISIIFISSFRNVYDQYSFYFLRIEYITVFVFSLEYILRLWVSNLLYKTSYIKSIFHFAISPVGIIDLIAIIPFYLPLILEESGTSLDLLFIRAFRMFSMLRFFTFSKHGFSVKVLFDVVKELKFELTAALFIISMLIVISATIMFTLENKAQPEVFKSIGDAFWWAIITLSTVGYGDMYPVTLFGKILGSFVALFGVGIFVIPATLISAAFVQKMQEYKHQRHEKTRKEIPIRYCPHCGEKLEQKS